MEKTRVPRGDWYWFIFRTKGGGFVVNCKIEEGSSDDNARFDIGNYFIVKEEAKSMARKLRAVLKGAEAIEMPSEDEIIIKASNAIKGNDLSFIDENTRFKMAYGLLKWLCSKIVK